MILSTMEQGVFTFGDQMVESKVLIKYFATQYSVQYSRHCVEILDAIPLAATIKDANFMLEEFYEIVNFD